MGSETNLPQMVEGSPVATFVIARDQVVTHWNRACQQLTGKRRDEIVGTRRQWSAFYADERPVLADMIVDGGDPAAIAEYYGNRFGSLNLIEGAYYAEGFFPQFGPSGRWLYFTAAPLRDEDNRMVGAIETLQDFTARRRSEAALAESEEKYRSLHGNVPVGLFRVAPDGEVLSVNPALVKMFGGTSEADLIGVAVMDTPVGPEKGRMLLDRIRTEGGLEDLELLLEKNDGSPFWGSISATPVRDAEGRTQHFDGIIQDITERKLAEKEKVRLQEQLRQVQKMEAIGTLAGGIAHDFNNIIGGIMGYTELLLEEIAESENHHRYYLSQIDRATRRARELVNQILEFSRQSRIEFRPLDIRLIIQEAVKLLHATLPKHIEIVQHISADKAHVLADATQVHQIIMNLCTNAYHAIGHVPGTLTLELDRITVDASQQVRLQKLPPGSYLRLSVRDTGAGIDPEDLDKIFDPYYTTKERGEGTGLGLAVTLGIVNNHHGGLTVESRPGRGSTFRVFLPVIEPESVLTERTEATVPGGAEHVLFVDDEAFFRDIVLRQLQNLGYRVTSAAGAMEALNAFRLRSEDFDLIITDQTMPEMTGVELAGAVRKIRPDMPIILCTGFSETVDEKNAPSFGIAKFVMKPVSRNQLARAIREVLD